MRLSYLIHLAAAVFTVIMDTTSGVTMSKSTLNVVLANAHGSTENGHRFLRQNKVIDEDEDETDAVDDDDDEERGILDTFQAGKVTAKLLGTNGNMDEMTEIVSKISNVKVLEILTSRGMSAVKDRLPAFNPAMNLDDFLTMLRQSDLSGAEQDLMIVAFTTYLAVKA